MTDYEQDLLTANAYLVKKDASVEQLNRMAAKLRTSADVMSLGDAHSPMSNRLRLRAASLQKLASEMQASLLDDIQRFDPKLKNDRRLSEALDAAPSNLSRVRNGYLPLGALTILRIHELTDWPVRSIKARLNLPCLPSLVARSPT